MHIIAELRSTAKKLSSMPVEAHVAHISIRVQAGLVVAQKRPNIFETNNCNYAHTSSIATTVSVGT
jgi:hypothetical protein